MKTTLCALLIVVVFASCSTYNVSTFTTENANIACKSPVYALTGFKRSATSDGGDLSLYEIIKDVQTKYGINATVQNVRWDMKNKKRVSVVYDVIRCNPE